MILPVVFSGRSRPSDRRRGGGSHPDPQIRGGPVSKRILFVLQASFWSKNKKGGGGSPGSATGIIFVWFKLLKSRIRNCDFSNNTISWGICHCWPFLVVGGGGVGGAHLVVLSVVCIFCECYNKLYNRGCNSSCNNSCNNSWNDVQLVNIFCYPFFICTEVSFNFRL